MIKTVDQLNRPIELMEPAKRIVSLVPSISEYLFSLGLNEQVVAITKFCIKPDSWFKTKTRIGGTKNISLDRIKALKPDLIIANKEENTKEQIDLLALQNQVYITDINSIKECYNALQDIGVLCDREHIAKEIINQIKFGFFEIKNIFKSKTCLYLIWQEPYMLAGKNTFINDIINHLGLNNLAVSIDSRYPEINTIEIEQLNPDYIFLSSEPFPFNKNHLSQIQFKHPNSKVFLVDGEAFSWYGSRLIESISYFKELILS
jgi:ABC-type Fe3+-hydroxamate transport system substrate-binding protein